MNNDDDSLFRESLKDVSVLEQDTVLYDTPRPRPVPVQTRRNQDDVHKQLLTENASEPIATGEELSFLRPGVHRNVLRRLRRGEFAIIAELDLHGHTVTRAEDALNRFLNNMHSHNRQCVRIIHGKGLRSPGGQPVLRQWLDQTLRLRDSVLAFCTALPRDGGTGAIYLLFKRR